MKATRFGAMSLSITAGVLAPLLAQDQKITLPKDIFAALTVKDYKTGREKMLAGVRSAIDGKLRTGIALDASMKDLASAVDAFKDVAEKADEPASEEANSAIESMSTVEPPKAITEPGATYDAEPFKAFLREKGMGEDDIMKACDMMPKAALAGDEDDEEAKKKKEEEEKKAAADKSAKDAELKAKDAEMKDMVSKPAMDAALKAQADTFHKEVQKVRDTERAVRVAIAEVHPWTGDLPVTMAFDTAADVYRHALTMRSVEGAKTLHADALLPILKTLPKTGARAPDNSGDSVTLAMDASVVGKAIKMAPGLEGISTIL
jgi:hypothetical protein